jgi:hypothetical protein
MYQGEFFQGEIGLGQGMKSAPLIWDIYLYECLAMIRAVLQDPVEVKKLVNPTEKEVEEMQTMLK